MTEEVNELFVPENKLDLVLSDANILPTVAITEVMQPFMNTHMPYYCCGNQLPCLLHHRHFLTVQLTELFTVTWCLETQIYFIIYVLQELLK